MVLLKEYILEANNRSFLVSENVKFKDNTELQCAVATLIELCSLISFREHVHESLQLSSDSIFLN